MARSGWASSTKVITRLDGRYARQDARGRRENLLLLACLLPHWPNGSTVLRIPYPVGHIASTSIATIRPTVTYRRCGELDVWVAAARHAAVTWV